MGRTPLHYAAGHNHAALVATLLEHGANVNAKDNVRVDPRRAGALRARGLPRARTTPPFHSVRVLQGGWTPLHNTAGYGHTAIVTMLLDRGADVNAKTPDGSTPLHSAAGFGHTAVVTVLVFRGTTTKPTSPCC